MSLWTSILKTRPGVRLNSGFATALAYYVGEPRNKNETKTKWLMHELTVPELDKEKGPENAAGEKPRDHMVVSSD